MIIMNPLMLDALFQTHFSTDLSNLVPVQFIETEETAVTVPPNDADAFNLKPPLAGTVKVYTNKNRKNNIAVYRGILGYSKAQNAYENQTEFVFNMAMMINDGLLQLTREIGDLKGRKVTCARPGQQGKIFRDVDNMAGFEFRIFVPLEE